jgi:hypothetical protein
MLCLIFHQTFFIYNQKNKNFENNIGNDVEKSINFIHIKIRNFKQFFFKKKLNYSSHCLNICSSFLRMDQYLIIKKNYFVGIFSCEKFYKSGSKKYYYFA